MADLSYSIRDFALGVLRAGESMRNGFPDLAEKTIENASNRLANDIQEEIHPGGED